MTLRITRRSGSTTFTTYSSPGRPTRTKMTNNLGNGVANITWWTTGGRVNEPKFPRFKHQSKPFKMYRTSGRRDPSNLELKIYGVLVLLIAIWIGAFRLWEYVQSLIY